MSILFLYILIAIAIAILASNIASNIKLLSVKSVAILLLEQQRQYCYFTGSNIPDNTEIKGNLKRVTI